MITAEDVFFNDGRLCINAGRLDASIRGSEFNGERVNAMLCSADGIEDVSWSHMTAVNGRRCVTFNPCPALTELPVPASELCSSLKPRAFQLVLALAEALDMIGRERPQSIEYAFGSLPLGSVYFLPESGKVLVLPGQLCRMVDSISDDSFRKEDRQDWRNLTAKGEYAKLNWLCQLVYYALSGRKPYGDPDVVENYFKAIPLRLLLGVEGPDRVVDYIDNVLSMPISRQEGTRKACRTFADSFSKASEGLDPCAYSCKDNDLLSEYLEKNAKKAKVHRFLRKKGTVLGVVGGLIALALGVGIWYIFHINAAPETKDCEPEQIVEYYYDAMNALEADNMTSVFVNGVTTEDCNTVATVYAKLTMKSAYQNTMTEVMTFDSWVESGQGEIRQGDIVHGVTDLEITKVDDLTYRASCLLWTSTEFTGLDEETGEYLDDIDYTMVNIYRQTATFSFKLTKRGWYLISNAEVENELVETRRLNYIAGSGDDWMENFSINGMLSFM